MLTIAIPSYQRRGHLDRLLGSIETAITALGERDTDIEVLVVLDGSTDGSTELIEQRAARYPVPLRAVWQENRGPAVARNRCADEAAGTLIWFLDDDMTITPLALATHLTWDRRQAPMLMGPCTIRSDDVRAVAARDWYGARWAKLAALERLTEPDDITFANASLPAALIREHRFSDRFRGYGPEDHELAIRLLAAGVGVAYSTDADVEHDFTAGSDERLQKLRQEGRNRMLLVELHPQHRELVFTGEPGLFERAARRLTAVPASAQVLWSVARLVSWVGTKVPRRAVRFQHLAETAAVYAGVAGALRDGSRPVAW